MRRGGLTNLLLRESESLSFEIYSDRIEQLNARVCLEHEKGCITVYTK